MSGFRFAFQISHSFQFPIIVHTIKIWLKGDNSVYEILFAAEKFGHLNRKCSTDSGSVLHSRHSSEFTLFVFFRNVLVANTCMSSLNLVKVSRASMSYISLRYPLWQYVRPFNLPRSFNREGVFFSFFFCLYQFCTAW